MGYVYDGGIGLFRSVFVSFRGGVASSLPVAQVLICILKLYRLDSTL